MDDSTGATNLDFTLSPVEARVLGCLIEKELTTPEYYPLTLNALVNACNQKSNRNPVMALTPADVETALDTLRRLGLAALFSGADSRVPKFKQTIDRVFPMETADRAVLCELLLRGPQTVGELRGRCDRMHPFPDLATVAEAIERLENRPAGPLVVTLPRQPGRKEPRHAQLLTGRPAPEEAAPTPGAAAGPVTVEMKLPPAVEERFAALEAEVARLRSEVDFLRRELGISAPATPSPQPPPPSA